MLVAVVELRQLFIRKRHHILRKLDTRFLILGAVVIRLLADEIRIRHVLQTSKRGIGSLDILR